MNLNSNLHNSNLEQLKIDNPKQWFKEVLCEQDFIELDKLYNDSYRRINRAILIEDGVCDIKDGKLLGIYWPGKLFLSGTNVTKLHKFKEVKGDLVLEGLLITSLGDLERVGGNVYLDGSRVVCLGNLIEIGGNLDGRNTIIKSLGKLEIISGNLDLEGLDINSFGKLERVGGYLDIRGTKIIELGKLKKVGTNFNLEGTNIELQLEVINKINNLTYNPFNFVIFGGEIKDIEKLFELEIIPGSLGLTGDDKIKNFNIKNIEKDLYLKGINISTKLYFIDKIINFGLNIGGNNSNNKDFKKYFDNNKLNFEIFNKNFGDKSTDIDDKDIRIFSKGLLIIEYRRLIKEMIKKVENVNNEEELKELGRKLGSFKKYLLNFGVNEEEIDISDILLESKK